MRGYLVSGAANRRQQQRQRCLTGRCVPCREQLAPSWEQQMSVELCDLPQLDRPIVKSGTKQRGFPKTLWARQSVIWSENERSWLLLSMSCRNPRLR